MKKHVCHDLSHLFWSHALWNAHLVQHNADVLLGKDGILPAVPAQHGHGAGICVEHPQNQADGGAFARAVFADEPQNAAPGQGQIQILQRKISKMFC